MAIKKKEKAGFSMLKNLFNQLTATNEERTTSRQARLDAQEIAAGSKTEADVKAERAARKKKFREKNK